MKLLNRLLLVLASASFFYASAHAQNAGSVANHAFAIGKGPGVAGYTSLLCGSAQLAVGQAAADPICRTITGDVTITAAGVTAIGGSKVLNSMLATMAANTTKCNATAGSANPTDCNASTMRTNIGVVIGTNVQAWDTDLDCLAALSSTGVVSRTGSGTCSAGALALSGLATGTQDTIIGYWGSTTATALAINNCTGALTYSTSTHTFGCNTSGGTGTVTTITAGSGISLSSGATCTTTCTASVSLNSFSSVAGSDVALSAGTWTTGASIAQGTSGTWHVCAQIAITDSSTNQILRGRITDGTNIYASAAEVNFNATNGVTLSMCAIVTNPAGNLAVQGMDSAATGTIRFNYSGQSKDTQISAFRIG